MAEATAAPVQHPLAKLVADAQAVLAAHAQPVGPSKADTIQALIELLQGPRAIVALEQHRLLVEELRLAERIIVVMLNEMTLGQKGAADKKLTDEGVSPAGLTRYHERRTVLKMAGAA